jgi:hypothetical protein
MCCRPPHGPKRTAAADFVEASHDAAFQERPEAIDGLSMHNTIDILPSAVPDGLMFLQIPIARVFVRSNQADFLRNGFANEAVQSVGIGAFYHTRNDIAFALGGANDGFFAFAASAFRALILMPVPVLAADVGFVNFNNAHKLAEAGIRQASADAMAHIMSGRIGTKTHTAMDLEGRNTLFAGQHQIDNLEPSFERHVRVFKDRADKHRKPIAALFNALRALPVERPIGHGIDVLISTARACNDFWPAARDKIPLACIIVREQFFKLRNCHLLGEFRARCGALQRLKSILHQNWKLVKFLAHRMLSLMHI